MEARFLISRKKVRERFHALRKLGIGVSYSVKTNPAITAILEKDTDALFSIHTAEELHFVKDKKRTWFFLQATNREQLSSLMKQSISQFVVDNKADLKTLLLFLERSQKKISLLLRMKLSEETMQRGKYFVFGMDAESLNAIIPSLRNNRNIGKLGIHFHRKTQNVSEWSLKEELQDAVSEETLACIDILNIGGGFPVQYRNYSADVFQDIVAHIRELKRWLKPRNIEIIAEPGRFIAAPAVKLEAEIIGIDGNNLTLNCSVYNASMDTLIVPIKLRVEGEQDAGEEYTLKGCTPCSTDILRYKVCLRTPKIGDTLTFLNAGAYTFSTDFCSLHALTTKITE